MCFYQPNLGRYCRHDIWVSSSCLGCLGNLMQWKSAISSERKWEGFSGSWVVKDMPHLTNQFSVLENCTVGITSDMLHSPPLSGWTETKPAMSKTPPVTPTVSETNPPPHVYALHRPPPMHQISSENPLCWYWHSTSHWLTSWQRCYRPVHWCWICQGAKTLNMPSISCHTCL